MGFGSKKSAVTSQPAAAPVPVPPVTPVQTPTLAQANPSTIPGIVGGNIIPPVPPAANPPTLASSAGTLANAKNATGRMKAAGGMGFDGTIGTSPQGLTEQVNLGKTTLLGS